MRLSRTVACLAVCISLAFGVSGGRVAAAEAVNKPAVPLTPGIALTPAIQEKILNPKETSAEFSVQLFNQTNKPLTFQLSSTDFTSLDQSGGLSFLGSDSERLTKGHGLSSAMVFEAKQVTLAPDSARVIKARINDVGSLAPGGHYTAIIAKVVPDGSSGQSNKIGLNQALSSLIFLETAGQGTKTLNLLQPPFDDVVFKLPDQVNLVFDAKGNTQTIPRGIATLSHGNTVVMRGIINDNSSLILPGSTRLLTTKLTGETRPFWPGVYRFEVQYRYEGSLSVSSYQKTFVYLNIQAGLVTLLLLILIVYFGIRGRRFWRRRVPNFLKKNPLVSPPRKVVNKQPQTARPIVDIQRVKKRPE